MSSTLQEVNVRVWENSQCAANYAQLDRRVLGTMLCAGETNRWQYHTNQHFLPPNTWVFLHFVFFMFFFILYNGSGDCPPETYH